VHRDAPPFFVLHGESDAVIPSMQARTFVDALREAGSHTVGYAELPHAHHAFDLFSTVRSRFAANAVADFLGVVYGRYACSQSAVSRERANPAS
jgi:acetyl esterase/lipase